VEDTKERRTWQCFRNIETKAAYRIDFRLGRHGQSAARELVGYSAIGGGFVTALGPRRCVPLAKAATDRPVPPPPPRGRDRLHVYSASGTTTAKIFPLANKK